MQTRAAVDKPWRDYEAYRNLNEAQRVAADLARKRPQTQVRIFNRLTKQVMLAKK